VGTIFAILIVFFIVVSTAATLHKAGIQIDERRRRSARLATTRGPICANTFWVGLFGASMLAAGVLPLATAYSISEALGFEKASREVFVKRRSFSARLLFWWRSARRSRRSRTCR
jgi:Mn2+/Fe2+ NRAMP family transporter